MIIERTTRLRVRALQVAAVVGWAAVLLAAAPAGVRAQTQPSSSSAVASAAPAAKPASATTKKKSSKKHHSSRREPSQKAPTADRIEEIQSALSRNGFYDGNPNGKWDSATIAAMQNFQSANGLDATGKLDALSLQKLGLGSEIAGVFAPEPPRPAPAPAAPSKPAPSSATPATAQPQKPDSAAPSNPQK
jgi:peptidoglycan hydrolase-like protein with peptidoglycan-binding domain